MSGREIESAQVAAAAPELNISTRWSWAVVAIEFALFAGALALLWPTTSSLIVEWEDTNKTTYTHGYLIVLICAWLLLRGRDVREAAHPAIRVGLLAPIAAISVLWLLALRSGLQAAHQVLLPPLFLLALWSTLGFQAALRAAFTAGYLYFAIPVWGVVNGLLQSTTTLVVGQLLRITGVHAYVDGNIVHLAAGTFEIAGGCSGLHFFIVGTALAALYGEIHRDNLVARLKLLMLAIGLALLANWLRVYIIVLAGYLTDMQHYLVRVSHYGFGWAVFAVTMVAFFFIASRMAVTGAATPVPAVTRPKSQPGLLLLTAALSLAAVAVGPVWNILVPLRTTPIAVADEARLPRNPGAWAGPVKGHSTDWLPAYPAADAVQLGTYSNGALNVQMFTAVYASQSQGKELVTYDNSIAGDADVLESRDLPSAKELVIAVASGQRWVVRYFYQIDSLRTHRDLEEQLRYGLASLAGQPASAIFAFGSPCVPDCDVARAAIDSFATDASPQIMASPAGTQDDHS
jgi:EpsI family protein